jgi:hypothetical protein
MLNFSKALIIFLSSSATKPALAEHSCSHPEVDDVEDLTIQLFDEDPVWELSVNAGEGC